MNVITTAEEWVFQTILSIHIPHNSSTDLTSRSELKTPWLQDNLKLCISPKLDRPHTKHMAKEEVGQFSQVTKCIIEPNDDVLPCEQSLQPAMAT